MIITMYHPGHPPPHFHARYGEYQAQIEIATGALLRDVAFFGSATVDPEIRTVVWPNGADLAPDSLHDGGFDAVSAA